MTTSHPSRAHHRACNLCEAICGLAIEMDGDDIVAIRGDEHDPLSRGHICPKAVALQDIWQDPDRLKRPIRRDGDRWDVVTWDEAFDEVAVRLLEIQERHGRDAVAVYQGNPTVHNSGTMLFAPAFVRELKTRNRFSASSVDQQPHHVAAYFMFGHRLMLPVPDVDRTQHMLIMGANPVASNGSMMTAPGIRLSLRAIQKRDGRVIVVDPRRTETSRIADEHHFIRPGTDVLLLLGLLHTLFAEDVERMRDVVNKFSRVRGVPEFSGEFPVAVLSEEILTPGQGQIRALVTSAGNPVLSTPDGGTLDRALAGLDFMVSVDIYLNETTRHADLILPPAWGLETDHYDLAFHGLAVRNTAKYSPAPIGFGAQAWSVWRVGGAIPPPRGTHPRDPGAEPPRGGPGPRNPDVLRRRGISRLH